MTTDTAGGVWSYALTLAEALAPHGVEIVLASMGGNPSAAQQRAAGERPNVTLVASRYRLEWMEEPWRDVAAAGDWLLQLEQDIVPDVVHLNGYAHAALAWYAPTVVVAHSCVLSWWRAVKHEAAPATWDRYREAVVAGLHAAGLVIAPTRAMLDALQREHGALAHARVAPNAVSPARHWVGPKEPYVLAAGRLWDEAKNIATLAGAASQVGWPLYVAGAGQPCTGARCLGELPPEALSAWMACAPIFAAPARYEPFGLAIVEAALSGCALVLGDIASLRENWDGAALFVSPDDERGLTRALELLIADRAYRVHAAGRARQRARERFSSQRMAEAYLDAYAQVRAERALCA